MSSRVDFISRRDRLRNSMVEFLNNPSETSITLQLTNNQFESLKKDYPHLEASKNGPIAGSYKYECTFKKTQ